jgi:signal recognition particle receptor subunit beta
MVQINFAQKEIQCKIVYYGPGMSGKTTNLELVHGKVPEDHRGELTSIATTGERTLYFDYMPLDLGQIAGIRTKFQLYTVPGQIYYKSTRRLVLQGVDGVVFVADSSASKMKENLESLADLEENLKEMGKNLRDVPIVIQYNKRDLPDAVPLEELEQQVNPNGFPSMEAVATRGEGVFPTLKRLASLVLDAVNKGGLAAPRVRAVPKPARVQLAAEPAGAVREAVAAGAAMASSPLSASSHGGSPLAASTPAARVPPPPTPAPRTPSTPPPPAPHRGPAVPGPASLGQKAFEERMVTVSGLGGQGGSRIMLLLCLGALIAAAAFFVVTKVL